MRNVPDRRQASHRRLLPAIGSAIFFLSAPGVVAGLIPWYLTEWRVATPIPLWDAVRPPGVVLTFIGLAVLVNAFARFVVEGIGTPAPIAPTRHLVVGGLYRYVRNPMYIAVVSVVVGQCLVLGQPVLLAYAASAGLLMAAFARWVEEPMLVERFGAEYHEYREAVPGWWPRLHAWHGPGSDSNSA